MQETRSRTRSPASESFPSRRLGRRTARRSSSRRSWDRTASLRRHTWEERFEIVAGTLGLRVGGEEIVALPGGTLTIPAGSPHRFWNAGDDEVRFRCEVRPALQFEQLLETMFALAVDGKTNKKGMPNLLHLAVIAGAHFDVVRLPFPPASVQRLGLVLGAAVGRLVGYGPTHDRTAEPLSANA